MEEIEELLRKSSQERRKTEPPVSFTNTIKNSLMKDNEKVRKYYLAKMVATVAIVILVCVMSVSACTALGEKIIPIIESLGIKFSNEYENYVIDENQMIMQNGTTIQLVSKVCDDGFTILEFDVRLSDKDKEYLKIGQNATYEYITSGENGTVGFLHKMEKEIEPEISFNNKMIENENHLASLNNFCLLIDGEEYWIRPRATQTVSKISDSEYKIFQMYFLTEKELKDKTEFKITLKNIAIRPSHGEEEGRLIPLEGEFNILLSKEKALENTNVISYDKNNKVTYKKMTMEVTKIRVTPLQIIAEVTSTIHDVSLGSLSTEKHEDFIGINTYKVYNQNRNELLSNTYETKRTIKYADGRVEEWEMGDIGTYHDFKNAEMILKEYIIIEKKNNIESITIAPAIKKTKETIELEKMTFDMKPFQE